MATPSIPRDISAETIVGVACAALGGLYLLVHAPQVPGFVVTLLVGFGTSSGFFAMLGALLAAAIGVVLVVHGRRRRTAHLAFVARVAAMRKRHPEPQPQPAPPTGVGIGALPLR